jgi:hypothetical protein
MYKKHLAMEDLTASPETQVAGDPMIVETKKLQ